MGSDSEDEASDEVESWQGSTGCVILINCYDPLSKNTAIASYRATCELIHKNMRQLSSGLFGICLYGTKDTPTSGFDVPNLVQIQPLSSLSLQDYKNILSQDVATYGQAKELNLSDVLWHCSKMFKQCNKRLGEKTVFMMTGLDVPPSNLNAKVQHQILKRVVDLTQLGIKLKVINVSECQTEPHAFYKELLKAASGDVDVVKPEPVWHSNDIHKLMEQYTHRHLAISQLSFDIGNDISIGVGVYKLVQPHPKPKTVKLTRDTNAVVISKNRTMKVYDEADDYDSSQVAGPSQNRTKEVPVLKSELLYYQLYGGEKVEFTHNELQKVKQPFQSRILKLLGFKPQRILCKEKWFLKQCDFLFPNESLVEGSTVAFRALHQACSEMSMLPICVMCARASSKPKIVALSPCTKPLGLNIDIGFNIIYIPFLENLKEVPVAEENEEIVEPAQKTLMQCVMSDLEFHYKSDTFENPTLQSLYSAIEALALEKENVDSIIDSTNRDNQIKQKIDAELFEEIFGPFSFVADKRPGSSNSGGSSAKREKPAVDVDEKLFEDRLGKNEINKYTVPELKKILQWKNPPGLPALTGKKKDELLKLVLDNCT